MSYREKSELEDKWWKFRTERYSKISLGGKEEKAISIQQDVYCIRNKWEE